MFKLVILFAVIAVAAAKPGFLAAVPAVETRTSVIGSSTIESHGNGVVHAAAPVTTSISSPAVIESRSVYPAVAHVAPVLRSAPIVHSAPVGYSAPVITSYTSSYAAPSPLFYSSPYLAAQHYF